MGVHQRVLEHALQRGAAQSERAAGQQRHDDARQAHRPDDLPGHAVSGRQMSQLAEHLAQAQVILAGAERGDSNQQGCQRQPAL